MYHFVESIFSFDLIAFHSVIEAHFNAESLNINKFFFYKIRAISSDIFPSILCSSKSMALTRCRLKCWHQHYIVKVLPDIVCVNCYPLNQFSIFIAFYFHIQQFFSSNVFTYYDSWSTLANQTTQLSNHLPKYIMPNL